MLGFVSYPSEKKHHELATQIRVGSFLFPRQAFGDLQLGNARCAVGAAIEAGYSGPEFPLRGKRCPECSILNPFGLAHKMVLGLVVHLNDYHEWSRERIADHLDSL